MKAVLLGYHAHHVVGADYARNDHRAFPADLELITETGWRIVPLVDLIAALAGGADGDEKLVALTFDDGPVYDVEDFAHPEFGPQRSFLNAMRDFRDRRGASAQPGLHATSFVIASPAARAAMESSFDHDYTWLEAGALSETWWAPATDTGLLGIGNHSWDHLHPALATVAHSAQARGDFRRVETWADADAQILRAQSYIAERTGGRAEAVFAYPFGHYNAFLAERYFPARMRYGYVGAVTVDPGPVDPAAGPWRLARYVCGHHWRSPEELAAILG
jgi:peptidoglycan/xylan/chitin deacetylase (PgdA/CDA1 family)